MISRNCRLPLSEKLSIINECEYNCGYSVAHQHKITPQAVSYLVKNKQRFVDAVENGRDLKLRAIKNHERIDQLDLMVSEFILQVNNKGRNLNGRMIREYAHRVATDIGYNNFQASPGWFGKFKSRQKIKYKKYVGEEGLVDPLVVNEWFSKIPDLKEKYKDYDLLNADETALFYKCQPDHSYFHQQGKTNLVRFYKQRVSILFCVSSTGDKFSPIIIGKAAKPRCFKGQEEIVNQVIWRNNKKGWMTSIIFDDWVNQLDDYYSKRDSKAVLFIDNFAGHQISIEPKNICIEFLPPNTTSLTQPLDGGIIHSFKANYRSVCTKSALDEIENDSYYKNFTLVDAIDKVCHSFSQVSQETIVNCWKRCHF